MVITAENKFKFIKSIVVTRKSYILKSIIMTKKTMIFSCLISINTMFSQLNYVDLNVVKPSITTNPQWSLVFSDEFNGSKKSMWQPTGCSGNSAPDAPYYNRTENYVLNPTYLSLKSVKENHLATYGFGHYATKKYTTAAINSDVCGPFSTTPITDRLWLYGYFEIKCRNPKAQGMFPAFWLYGEHSQSSSWNEIDVYEYGVGDDVVLSHHYQPKDPLNPNYNKHIADGNFLLSLPGQTFGNTWVNYAVRWEPNKIIWYINNQVVKIVTDRTGNLIPNVAMHLIANSGNAYSRYNQYLPNLFPNNMDIDYIRVYQRVNNTIPDPSFTINGLRAFTPATPLNIATNKIILNGSESIMPNHQYFLEVQECNNLGAPVGSTSASAWLSNTQIDQIENFDIVSFCQSKSYPLSVNKTYLIKLAGSPWIQIVQYIKIINCINSISFKINGNPNSTTAITIPYNFGKPKIILDASLSNSCLNTFSISINPCLSNGTQTGSASSRALTVAEVNGINKLDIESICLGLGYTMSYNSYHNIKLTSSSATIFKNQIIYIPPRTAFATFTINEQSTTFPNAINIANGEDILLDGSASTLTENKYFIQIQECDNGGSVFGPGPNQWNNYAFYDPYYKFWVYDLGRFNIREYCRNNSFALVPGHKYRIKLAAGSPWTEYSQVIYIEPCTNSNSTFIVNPTDQNSTDLYANLFSYDPAIDNRPIYIYGPNCKSCDQTYFLAVQKTVAGVRTGVEAAKWLTLDEITSLIEFGNFDLRKFCKDPNGDNNSSDELLIQNNSTYLVKLVAGGSGSWVENFRQLVFGTGSKPGKNTIEYENAKNLNSINEYFNPENKDLIITAKNNDIKIACKLLNMQGQLIKAFEFFSESFEIKDVNLSSGIYFINYTSNNETRVNKIIIK